MWISSVEGTATTHFPSLIGNIRRMNVKQNVKETGEERNTSIDRPSYSDRGIPLKNAFEAEQHRHFRVQIHVFIEHESITSLPRS